MDWAERNRRGGGEGKEATTGAMRIGRARVSAGISTDWESGYGRRGRAGRACADRGRTWAHGVRTARATRGESGAPCWWGAFLRLASTAGLAGVQPYASGEW